MMNSTMLFPQYKAIIIFFVINIFLQVQSIIQHTALLCIMICGWFFLTYCNCTLIAAHKLKLIRYSESYTQSYMIYRHGFTILPIEGKYYSVCHTNSCSTAKCKHVHTPCYTQEWLPNELQVYRNLHNSHSSPIAPITSMFEIWECGSSPKEVNKEKGKEQPDNQIYSKSPPVLAKHIWKRNQVKLYHYYPNSLITFITVNWLISLFSVNGTENPLYFILTYVALRSTTQIMWHSWWPFPDGLCVCGSQGYAFSVFTVLLCSTAYHAVVDYSDKHKERERERFSENKYIFSCCINTPYCWTRPKVIWMKCLRC